MLNLNLPLLVVIALGSMLVVLPAAAWLPRDTQRAMLVAITAGLFFFSGIGASSQEVSGLFVAFYFVTLGGIVLSFIVGLAMFGRISRSASPKIISALGDIDGGKVWTWAVVAYVALLFFPLLWPEVRLDRLLSPPAPDLRAVMAARFEGTIDPFTRLVGYGQLLLTPFFYVALYRWRDRMWFVLLLLVGVLYLEYIAAAYVGRGVVLKHLVLWIFGVWWWQPRKRKWILLGTFASMPFVLYASYWYARARLGAEAGSESLLEAMGSVLAVEWSFVERVGMPLLESGRTVDLPAYALWVATLPLPKIFTGPIEGARINYEISEIVLGVAWGAPGSYVVLPGLVAESVYVFGPFLFWIHALCIGVMAAAFVSLTERIPPFGFVFGLGIWLFGYVLNRAGISAVLPVIMNEFLLFYCVLGYVYFRSVRPRDTAKEEAVFRRGLPVTEDVSGRA